MAEAAVTEESGDVITQCTCKIKKKDYTVAVTNSNLRWHLAGNKGQKDLHVVRIEDILSAKLQTSSKQASDSDSVKICYVKQEKKLILKMCSVVFTSADLQLVKKLHQQVTDLIALVQQRPKRLLVLINPVSGRSKGRTMYEQKVAPIFKEAGIKTEVIVTERAHHTQEILLTYDITTIDGKVAEAAVTKESKDVITLSTCKIKKKDYTVALTNSNLRWHVAGSKVQKDLQVVRIEDIPSVKLRSSTKHETENDSVRVAYVKQKKKIHLVLCSVVLTSADLQLITKLHQQINNLIANVKQRPKKLLVLINPVSGRKKGTTVNTQNVAPMFQEAGIETEVIVTEKAHHAQEILLTYDIKAIDGLVVVDGDGLYHEALNGIMQRLTKEKGVDVDDPDVYLPEIPLRIGLIPCGTGNGVAVACYGNYDVTTAALSITVGHQMKRSTMSVHCAGKLVAYSILLVGYGIWGDIIIAAESIRDQGISRLPVMFITSFQSI